MLAAFRLPYSSHTGWSTSMNVGSCGNRQSLVAIISRRSCSFFRLLTFRQGRAHRLSAGPAELTVCSTRETPAHPTLSSMFALVSNRPDSRVSGASGCIACSAPPVPTHLLYRFCQSESLFIFYRQKGDDNVHILELSRQ